MELHRRQFLRVTAAAIGLPLSARLAAGQAYPSRPVRLVVGFPADGPVDIAARIIAPWLAERLGQPFIVDNQPGESGNSATRSVVTAAPDGYTLLVCGPVNTINTTLFQRLDYSFTRDIAPIASLWRVPLVIEVHPAVPAKTLPEFVAFAKANPGRVKIGYAGKGTPQHVAIELFKMMTGADFTLVPYLGSAPVLADLLEGKIDAMFDPLPSSVSHIRSGRLIPLAVTTSSRTEAFPDVPAASDVVPGYEAGSWFGIGAPKGTAADIVEKLNTEVNAGLETSSIKARLAELGASAVPGSPAQFGNFIVQETERYAGVIRAANIKAE
jgi:tripartite-type tricarboxylate transporter receptor subunit TctC